MAALDEAVREAPKMKKKKPEQRLKDLKRRNREVHQTDGPAVAQNLFLRVPAGIYDDEKFLLAEIDKLRKLLGQEPIGGADEAPPPPADEDGDE